jgi:hypothetical protein
MQLHDEKLHNVYSSRNIIINQKMRTRAHSPQGREEKCIQHAGRKA